MKSHTLSRIFRTSALGAIMVLMGAAGSVCAAETVLEFSGSDSHVLIGTPAALQIDANAPFTVEGWMYFKDLPTTTYPRDMFYSKNTDSSYS